MPTDPAQHPDQPKGDVEIIPPGEDRPRSGGFIYSNTNGSVRVVKLGPVGASVAGLALLALVTFGLLFVGGALLLILPVAAVLTVAGMMSGLISNPFKRLR